MPPFVDAQMNAKGEPSAAKAGLVSHSLSARLNVVPFPVAEGFGGREGRDWFRARVVPTGTRFHFLGLTQDLKSWAIICRPYGAVSARISLHLFPRGWG